MQEFKKYAILISQIIVSLMVVLILVFELMFLVLIPESDTSGPDGTQLIGLFVMGIFDVFVLMYLEMLKKPKRPPHPGHELPPHMKDQKPPKDIF
ncbi:MAG: hypothetical protein AB7E61_03780 [Acholeplasmataceae bacterium]